MSPDPDNDRITVTGKQILLDGRHLADGVSEEAALVLAIALAYAGADQKQMPEGWKSKLREFLE